MAKIKLTKSELKAQRDALQQFRRYLPTLQLKQQQLQLKAFETVQRLREAQEALDLCRRKALPWAGLLADPLLARTDEHGDRLFDLRDHIHPEKVVTSRDNIAGALVPVLDELVYPQCDYDLRATPFWVDRAIERLRELVRHTIGIQVIEERLRLLQQELRTTTHRVNLFEEVKIPEALRNIRRITIYLGDQQANAVGVAKAAKRKIERASTP